MKSSTLFFLLMVVAILCVACIYCLSGFFQGLKDDEKKQYEIGYSTGFTAGIAAIGESEQLKSEYSNIVETIEDMKERKKEYTESLGKEEYYKEIREKEKRCQEIENEIKRLKGEMENK